MGHTLFSQYGFGILGPANIKSYWQYKHEVGKLSTIVWVNIDLNRTVVVSTTCAACGIVIFRVKVSCVNTINWRDTTHFDSEDDYCSGCRNASHCQQQQQSYSGLHSPRRSYSTYLRNDSWAQTFHRNMQVSKNQKYKNGAKMSRIDIRIHI